MQCPRFVMLVCLFAGALVQALVVFACPRTRLRSDCRQANRMAWFLSGTGQLCRGMDGDS